MISHLLRVAILAALCIGTVPELASAERGSAHRGSVRGFDGEWSVLIVTQQGSCDRAYRYGVTIRNGGVYYSGGAANFSGRVAPNGSVSVRVSAGGSFANGGGRMSRNSGRGRWRGQSGGDRCSGYWTAERRG